jgi:hypothetical protein
VKDRDPKIIGPGTWVTIHVFAMVCEEADTDSDWKCYAKFTYRIIHAFPCSKCRRHAVKYLDQHPIPESKPDGSIFAWSVNFHNAVNRKLGKPQISVEEAREMYKNTEVILAGGGQTCSLKGPGCEDLSVHQISNEASLPETQS